MYLDGSGDCINNTEATINKDYCSGPGASNTEDAKMV